MTHWPFCMLCCGYHRDLHVLTHSLPLLLSSDVGLLLFNNVLTVEMGLAASHKDKWSEPFTDAVVAEVNRRHTPAVFMLWGSHAQKKAAKVDTGRHQIGRAHV